MEDEKKHLGSFLKEELMKWLARTAFVVTTGVLAMIFTPVGEKLSMIWAGPERVAEIQNTLEGVRMSVESLRREVTIARAPTEIVEYGPASSFSGACAAGQVCLLTLEIRRISPAAAECRIISGLTKRQIIAVNSGRTWEPEIEPASPRNVSETFVLTEIHVKMPLGLTKGEYFYRQTTFYEGCPWQVDGRPPVSSTSPLIKLVIE